MQFTAQNAAQSVKIRMQHKAQNAAQSVFGKKLKKKFKQNYSTSSITTNGLWSLEKNARSPWKDCFLFLEEKL
jgi:hypothetical protein